MEPPFKMTGHKKFCLLLLLTISKLERYLLDHLCIQVNRIFEDSSSLVTDSLLFCFTTRCFPAVFRIRWIRNKLASRIRIFESVRNIRILLFNKDSKKLKKDHIYKFNEFPSICHDNHKHVLFQIFTDPEHFPGSGIYGVITTYGTSAGFPSNCTLQ
jgi:hypothetical protein